MCSILKAKAEVTVLSRCNVIRGWCRYVQYACYNEQSRLVFAGCTINEPPGRCPTIDRYKMFLYLAPECLSTRGMERNMKTCLERCFLLKCTSRGCLEILNCGICESSRWSHTSLSEEVCVIKSITIDYC